ncbi:TolC family protein [Corticibacter populi]|nr:TolC family protein [Corticibacter populi]RZS32155.1 outer membrane protein TolC [Corticibacter populi]
MHGRTLPPPTPRRRARAWLAAALLAAGLPAIGQSIPSTPPPGARTIALAPASLQLAQQLTATSLADSGARRRLLDALHAMLTEHPEVLKARAAFDSAGHDLNTARGERWPRLKIGTNSGSADRSGNRENYNALNAEVRMSLLDGGAIGAGIRSAEFQQAAQAEVLHGTRQNVLLEALTALLELQRFEAKARIAGESAGIIAQLARIEERRAELGAVGRNDLRQAASRQAGARAQQHALESRRAEALARFTRYYGFAPRAEGLPALQVPGHWFPQGEAQALQAAEASSTELQEIARQVERARAEVDRSKAQRLPTLDAVVARSHDPKGVLYNDGTRYGVELNWNFGNGFELRDRILKALSELQSQEAQQEAVRRQVQEAASAAWGRVESGRQREAQLADAVQEARAAFEGRRRLLEVGRGSLAQVLDAQLDMQNLMLDEADAAYDQRITELQLVRTTGQLLPPEVDGQWLDVLFAQAPEPADGDTAPLTSPIPAAGAVAQAAPLPHQARRLQLRAERQLQLPQGGATLLARGGW